MVTNALSLICWPARVCFHMDIIFKALSLRGAPRDKNQESQLPWWAGRSDRSPPGTWSRLWPGGPLGGGHPLLVLGLAYTCSAASTHTQTEATEASTRVPGGLSLSQPWCHLPCGVSSEKTNLWVFIPFPNSHYASQNSLSGFPHCTTFLNLLAWFSIQLFTTLSLKPPVTF